MALFSCSKEATIEPNFVEKSFFVENPETATIKVLEFLSHTDLTETTLRSNFPDTEVNEGLWTLEAAGNYLENVNLALKSDVINNHTLSIININDNGILKMSGVDMTDKFNQLQAIIAAEEQVIGETAKIVDFEIQAISNQQTDLIVGVVYGVPPPPDVEGCEEWPASEFVEDLERCILTGTNNFAWYQTISINGDTNMSDCTEVGGADLYTFEGIYVTPDDLDGAYAISQDFIECKLLVNYGPPPPPNESHTYGPPRLVDINVYGAILNADNVFMFCNSITMGRGVPY